MTAGSFRVQEATGSSMASVLVHTNKITREQAIATLTEKTSRMNAYIHPTSFFESGDDRFPENEKWEDARVARHVLAKIDGNVTVGDLIDRLPFSRFKIYRAISELLSQRLIRPTDITAVVDRERRINRKVKDARTAAEAGRFTE